MGTFLERAVTLVNGPIGLAADVVLAPPAAAAPRTTLAALSVATGLALLWVVGRTSNQPGIAAARRGIHAALLEIRLFNDDLGAVARALGRVLAQNARYLGYSFVPLAWALAPLLLVAAQLQAFYGYDGLAVGQPALLTVHVRDVRAVDGGAAVVAAPEALRVETPAVVLPGARQVVWRLVPLTPGDYVVSVTIGAETVTKTVHVSGRVARRSPRRAAGLAAQLLYPSEPPIPSGGNVAAVVVPYPETGVDVLGWRVHWMILYVAIAMITAFALAPRLGVTL